MEASAGAPPRPEDITSRLTQLALQVMEGLNRNQNKYNGTDAVTNGASDVPQEREVNCPICFEQFSDTHAPRTVRCGHTICTPCLETILLRPAGDRNCPECRRPLKVTAVAHIPVSYTIMRLARALEETCAAAAAAEAEIEGVAEAGVLGETCIHHHYPVLWYCSSCEAFQCRSCPHHSDCPERMNAGEALVHLKQAQVEQSERTVLALNKLKSGMETQRDKLHVSIDRMMEEVRQLESKVKKVQQQVLDVEEAEAQVVEACSARRMTRALARSEDVQTLAKVWLEHQESRPSSPVDEEPINLDILRKKLLITKDVYAVKLNKDNVEIFAPITIYSDKMLVHNYSIKEPPPNATLISGQSIALSQLVERRSVFFDIHVDGRFEGRVIIILFKSASVSKSTTFMDLCTNSRGTSYKGLKMCPLNLTHADATSKVVQIGREIRNEPDRDVPVPGNDNYYHRNIYPGLVSGISANYEPNSEQTVTLPTMASFVVHLYHLNGANSPAGFGKVLSGLGVLRYAWDKRDAVIGDCGVVLPLCNV